MHFVVTENYEEMSRAAARLISSEIRRKPDASIVVAVGSSPLGAFRELARLHERGEFPVDQLRPFQLDEYLLPACDPRTLYGWVKRDFLDPLAIAETRFVRLRGDATDLAGACRAYDEAVARAGGFDIAILGLGPNGHLGFNEPPADTQAPTRQVDLSEASLQSNAVYWGGIERVPRQALTCGMTHLLAARHIFLLVSGAHKREILRQTAYGPITPAIPSSYLQEAQHVVVVSDRTASPETPSAARDHRERMTR